MKTFIRLTALFAFICFVLISIAVFLVLQPGPGRVTAQSAQMSQAESVNSLLGQLKQTIKQRYVAQDIELTQDQLTSLTGFLQRAVPSLHSQVSVSPYLSVLHVSYHSQSLPGDGTINMQVTILPGDQLLIGHVMVGSLHVPGWLATKATIAFLDYYTQSDIASRTVAQVKRVEMTDNLVKVSLGPMDAILKGLNEVRLGIGSGQNEPLRAATQHYLKFLDYLPIDSHVPGQSLGLYLSPLMKEAAKRSKNGDPVSENEAAIMALATYAGHHRFANFVGDVQPHEGRAALPYYRPVLSERTDLTQHFLYSAAIKLLSRKGISAAIGEFKELMDRDHDGSGYSFADLAADMAGIKFAEMAVNPSYASELQQRVASSTEEEIFFPVITDLPEGITRDQFDQIFGEIDSPKYRQMISFIEARLDVLPAYRNEEVDAISASRSTDTIPLPVLL